MALRGIGGFLKKQIGDAHDQVLLMKHGGGSGSSPSDESIDVMMDRVYVHVLAAADLRSPALTELDPYCLVAVGRPGLPWAAKAKQGPTAKLRVCLRNRHPRWNAACVLQSSQEGITTSASSELTVRVMDAHATRSDSVLGEARIQLAKEPNGIKTMRLLGGGFASITMQWILVEGGQDDQGVVDRLQFSQEEAEMKDTGKWAGLLSRRPVEGANAFWGQYFQAGPRDRVQVTDLLATVLLCPEVKELLDREEEEEEERETQMIMAQAMEEDRLRRLKLEKAKEKEEEARRKAEAEEAAAVMQKEIVKSTSGVLGQELPKDAEERYAAVGARKEEEPLPVGRAVVATAEDVVDAKILPAQAVSARVLPASPQRASPVAKAEVQASSSPANSPSGVLPADASPSPAKAGSEAAAADKPSPAKPAWEAPAAKPFLDIPQRGAGETPKQPNKDAGSNAGTPAANSKSPQSPPQSPRESPTKADSGSSSPRWGWGRPRSRVTTEEGVKSTSPTQFRPHSQSDSTGEQSASPAAMRQARQNLQLRPPPKLDIMVGIGNGLNELLLQAPLASFLEVETNCVISLLGAVLERLDTVKPLARSRIIGALATKLALRPSPLLQEFAEDFIVRLLTTLSGKRLMELKQLVDTAGKGADLLSMLDAISRPVLQNALLDHFEVQGSKVLDRPNHVLSDIDMTVWVGVFGTGGPKFPQGPIPGSISLFGILGGRITFLSARPPVWESRTRSALLNDIGIAEATVLQGTLENVIMVAVDKTAAHKGMGEQKHKAFSRFAGLHPECRFVFFGDSGEGDVEFATKFVSELSSTKKPPDRVALIHDVVGEDGIWPKTSPDVREMLMHGGVHVFDTYVGAALKLYELGVIDEWDLRSATQNVVDELTEIPEASFASKNVHRARRKELQRDVIAVNAALGSVQANSEMNLFGFEDCPSPTASSIMSSPRARSPAQSNMSSHMSEFANEATTPMGMDRVRLGSGFDKSTPIAEQPGGSFSPRSLGGSKGR